MQNQNNLVFEVIAKTNGRFGRGKIGDISLIIDLKSGLWNVNFVEDLYDRRFLDIFEKYVEITIGLRPKINHSLAPRDWYPSKKSNSSNNQLSFLED